MVELPSTTDVKPLSACATGEEANPDPLGRQAECESAVFSLLEEVFLAGRHGRTAARIELLKRLPRTRAD